MASNKVNVLSQIKNPNYIVNKTRRRELVAQQKILLKKVSLFNQDLFDYTSCCKRFSLLTYHPVVRLFCLVGNFNLLFGSLCATHAMFYVFKTNLG